MNAAPDTGDNKSFVCRKTLRAAQKMREINTKKTARGVDSYKALRQSHEKA